ncbi:DUF488 domain-containing protein [Novacetimonas hansenii]|uniref:DUF488 domain-containing protein n=1 Tax=Novacetimonas hansenii TaxID=436 RepID=UPI00177C8A70|nr:DUF488 domain-containing protein [Novacetimonas hansenii]QOF95458.1 DUF488 domain-containing protein [Novacetimonas hansenii]
MTVSSLNILKGDGAFDPVSNAFYTVGHSTHSVSDFIAILHRYNITMVVDVRAFPYSRRNREFDGSRLITELAPYGIGYRHVRELGGRRPRSKTVGTQTNAFWHVQSFHNYADYALGGEFHQGLKTLMELGEHFTVAIMCAEILWWRCHRRIITDYLLENHRQVFHILSITKIVAAQMTPEAVIGDDGCVTYPPSVPAS